MQHQLQNRYTWLIPGGTAVLAFAVYRATMAPGLTWAHYGADGGDLAIAVALGSVPHPSGYPTYLLVATLFQHLPWGDLHARLNLLSVTAAALGVGGMAWVGWRVFGSRWVGFLTAVTLLTSRLFWSQALIAEVHALTALFMVLLIAWAWRLREGPAPRAWLWAGGLVTGLALGNHALVALFLPGLGFFLGRHLRGHRWGWWALGVLVGLLPYAWLPLRARSEMPLNWGGADTWEGFWWLVSARLYRMYLYWPGEIAMWLRVRQWAALAADQFGWWGWPFLVSGLLLPAAGPARAYRRLTLWVAAAFTTWALLYQVSDWPVYTLPMWVVGSPWLAHGLTAWLRPHRRWRYLGVLVPLLTGVVHAPQVDLHTDRAAQASVRAVWQALPARALVLVDGDRAIFGLGYAHFVQAQRPDVRLVSRTLWGFPWYRRALHRYYGDLDPTLTLDALVSRGERPVYLVGDTLPAGLRLAPGRPYYRVVRVPVPGSLQVGRVIVEPRGYRDVRPDTRSAGHSETTPCPTAGST